MLHAEISRGLAIEGRLAGLGLSHPKIKCRDIKIHLSTSNILIPAPVLSARIDMILHAELSPLGFERTRPRRWVEINGPPLRRIFEFQALKGLRYSARWGFCVDFVPIKKAGRLRWKRTPKTAAFDLCIDPIDLEGWAHDWCSLSLFIFPSNTYDWTKVTRTVKNSVSAALSDFSRVNSIADTVALFRDRSKMKFHRFSLENYVQTHIAWGLCLIALGQQTEGEDHLEKYCERFSVDRDDRILREAERVAINITTDRL